MWLQAAALGADLLGKVFSGDAEAKAKKRQLQEEQRQFNLRYGLDKDRQAMDQAAVDRRNRGLARTGRLREQILQRLGLGMGPSRPAPTPSMGGY